MHRLLSDKQQEIDVPSLKVEDTDAHLGVPNAKAHNEKKKKQAPMSQISGVRKLKKTNSFTGTVPQWGIPVDVKLEEQVEAVSI